MTVRLRYILALMVAVALCGCATLPPGAAGKASKAGDKQARLDSAYQQFWQESLRLNPLQATFQGDRRYNGQLPNFLGADYRKRAHNFNARWLKTIQAIGPDGLSGQDLISYEIFVRDAKNAIEAERFPTWQLPINQFYSVADLAVTLGSGNGAQPFKTVQDYDNWRSRAQRLPAIFDQAIANMRQGVAAGVVQPRSLMIEVVPQLDAAIKDKPEDTVFWIPIKTMPPEFAEADSQRIATEYRSLIADKLVPAYKRLRDYIANDYLVHARAGVGLGGLPAGAAWYAFDVRQNTTTDLTPAQVHKLGLEEVARLQDEIRALMKRVRFNGTLQEFFKYMRSDKRFAYKDADAMLAHYRDIQQQVNAAMPELFALLPKAGLELRAVEPYRAQSAPEGEYRSGDGSHPAVFYVNTSHPTSSRTWEAEDLFLHEAVPGHHIQIALQQQLRDLPRFRRFGGETAFAEGWAVYAESLGPALGLYKDPDDRFGYLHSQLRRALRLVADTGLHDQRWSRERVIDYLLANSALTPAEAATEAERYMAVPGQALAYKIGELKIQALRANAQQAFGSDFDIRPFHAQILRDGSLPLGILEAKIDRWIAATQPTGKAAPAAGPAATKAGG